MSPPIFPPFVDTPKPRRYNRDVRIAAKGESALLHLREYARPSDLEEAWTLNQKKTSRILGGTCWLRLGERTIGTGIDLSGLGLDQITEDEEAFQIGAMVTLRQLELHPGVQAWTQGAVRESLRHIVGVQFRNCATVGGTVWGRFGFSDPLTCLLALDTQVKLYRGGVIPLTEFIQRAPDKDILEAVILRKTRWRTAYQSFRNTETDFPVLAVCVSAGADGFRCAVGARPGRAALVTSADPAALKVLAADLPYGDNSRASAAYRRYLSGVLIGRCLKKLEVDGPC